MADKVLVAYGSRYGATKEIAEKIGDVIRQAGMEVDVKPGNKVGNAQNYNAFVVGGAIYAGLWQKNAVNFVKTNASLLAGRPTWIFSSGPTGETSVEDFMKGWQYPAKLKPEIEQIKPKDITVFHGSIDPSDLNPLFKFMIKMVKAPPGDFRQWDVIENWAGSIAAQLKK